MMWVGDSGGWVRVVFSRSSDLHQQGKLTQVGKKKRAQSVINVCCCRPRSAKHIKIIL